MVKVWVVQATDSITGVTILLGPSSLLRPGVWASESITFRGSVNEL